MRLPLALVLLLAPLIAGCVDGGTPLPGTTKLLDQMPRVDNSTRSPCWQQRQIAAQNSYVATISAKKETVFKAPCDVDQKVVASQ